MEDFCRELFEAEGLQLRAPLGLTFFDVYVDPVSREFHPWEDIMKPFSYDPEASYFEMMVPTVDTTRFSTIFSALISQVRSGGRILPVKNFTALFVRYRRTLRYPSEELQAFRVTEK